MPDQSHRKVDENGFLIVQDTPVSSYGVFDYAAWQVGIEEGDPDRIVKVYRPESEISSPEAIASFQVVPFIDEHNVLSGFEDDDETMAPEDKGIDGAMFNVKYAKPWLRADVKVFTRRMQRAINSGKVELSLGYGCDFILKSGVFEGQSYEVMQINMRGNHLALVDAARVEGAKVLDSKVAFDCLSFRKPTPNGDNTMAMKGKGKGPVVRRTKVGDSSSIEKLKALLPALEQFLNEESTEQAHQEGQLEQGEQAEAVTVQPQEPAQATQTEEAAQPESGSETEDGASLEELIEQVEGILAELKGEASEVSDGEVEQVEDENLELEPTVKGTEPEVKTAEDCSNNGKVSTGPTPGKNPSANAGDAAVRRSIYADIATKNKLYERVSPIIGAFDHALMTSEDMAAYAAKKLNINAPKGMAAVALDSYLSGAERAKAVKTSAANVGDNAFGTFDPIDSYLKGGK